MSAFGHLNGCNSVPVEDHGLNFDQNQKRRNYGSTADSNDPSMIFMFVMFFVLFMIISIYLNKKKLIVFNSKYLCYLNLKQ